jgi:succinate dehydrogenase flavin-adding protein (antitoxin of CptAB toxin-antitoxin module)
MAEPIDLRRKRLLYRSLYTGTKETDLLLGAFARRYLPEFSVDQLDSFEQLLAAPDPEIYAWATRQLPTPPEFDTDVMALLKSFKIQA